MASPFLTAAVNSIDGYNDAVTRNNNRISEGVRLRALQQQEADQNASREIGREYAGQLMLPQVGDNQQVGQATGTQMPPAPAVPGTVQSTQNYGNEGRSMPAPKPAYVPDHAGAIKKMEDLKAADARQLALLQAGQNEYTANQRALAAGTVKPLAYVSDAVTMPIRGVGMLAEKGLNFAGNVVNSVAGRRVVKDDYDYMVNQGTFPYSDATDRVLNRAFPQSQQITDLQARMKGTDEGIAKLKELQAAAAKPAAPATKPTGTPAAPAGPVSLQDAVRYVESRGNMNAVSPKGAKSDMQVMDATNAQPGYGVTPARDGSLAERSRVGADYLAALQKHYGNDVMALIAYNWGPGNADKWASAGADMNQLPPETRSYLQQVAQYMGGKGGTAPTATGTKPATQVATATPAAAPAAQVQGQSPTFMQGGTDPEAQQRAAQIQYYAKLAQSTGGEMQMKALAQLEQLKIADYGQQLMQVATTASTGDQNAMNQLAGAYGRYSKTPVGIQMQNGTAVVHNGAGQVLMAGPPEEVSRKILNSIHSGLRQKQIDLANAYQQEYLKNKAYTEGRGAFEKEQEQMLEILRNSGKVDVAKIEAAIKNNEVVLQEDRVNGGVVIVSKHGGNVLGVVNTSPVNPKTGAPMTQPSLSPVKMADGRISNFAPPK